MNPTKSLITGAVALTAFASVLGLAYAQVENTTEATITQATDAQYPSTQTDPAMQAVPAERSMDPATSQSQSTDVNAQSQVQPEAQSQQVQPQAQPQTQSSDQWQTQQPTSQQDPLPTEPTAAGTARTTPPAPRADRN